MHELAAMPTLGGIRGDLGTTMRTHLHGRCRRGNRLRQWACGRYRSQVFFQYQPGGHIRDLNRVLALRALKRPARQIRRRFEPGPTLGTLQVNWFIHRESRSRDKLVKPRRLPRMSPKSVPATPVLDCNHDDRTFSSRAPRTPRQTGLPAGAPATGPTRRTAPLKCSSNFAIMCGLPATGKGCPTIAYSHFESA